MLKIVKTENGLVRGLPGNNTRISVFKGIPFALAPVGDLRWKAPQPASDWDGIYDAYKFAPISVQDQPGVGTDIYCREWHVDPDIEIDEDCLYLNVWTPAKSADEKLPVLVWFFGGGFQWGYTAEMEFNGENLAKKGIIVVTVNYRLGALGFLSHPELFEEAPDAPANFGILDQQAGLKWVIRNIEQFGGDPANITIAGQSAGGGSVLNHLTSESSIGLYQKAIVLSGMICFPYIPDNIIAARTREDACSYGVKLFEKLGVKTLEEARKLDAAYIREVYAKFREEESFFFTPMIDEVFLKDDPYKLLISGRHANVPLMSGNTYDEFPSFIPAESDEEFEKKARDIFGARTDEFLSFKEAREHKDNMYANVRAIECAVKAVFKHNNNPGYYYSFEPDIPGWDNPGTFHSVDLWFFFDNLDKCWRPMTGRHFDLARQMSTYFANFVKKGDPNGDDVDGTALPLWKPYSPAYKNGMYFTAEGAKAGVQEDYPESDFMTFITGHLERRALGEDKVDEVTSFPRVELYEVPKKQAFNPYLPNWEFIPDGEPYVFNGRVYVYGSHDVFNGHAFCLGDYVTWSAPIDDLGNWTYEGVIYKRTDDPANAEDRACLYAPDVTIGPDDRYYLFYVLDRENIVSVTVSDSPSGKFEFYGYVHYEDGELLGKKEGDEPQFDPGVLTIGDTTYLYTGFCGQGDKSRHGCMVTVLGPDMLTVKRAPEFVIPSTQHSAGSEYEGHAFFEAPSIRERNGIYYLIYSSQVMHELCYATATDPLGPFSYGGVIVSNCDIGIDTYKPADKPACFGANNHGSIIEINGEWYIFYHRQTNNDWYSRQGCAEKITFTEDGKIPQVEITSCGLNGGPLSDACEYSAYIACNIFDDKGKMYVGDAHQANISMDVYDGPKGPSHIRDIGNNTTIGFKYFDLKGIKGLKITTRGYGKGEFEIKTSPDGDVLGTIGVEFCTVWETGSAGFTLPDGVYPLYLTFKGDGTKSLLSLEFLH
jgi:carboxylesterase type B